MKYRRDYSTNILEILFFGLIVLLTAVLVIAFFKSEVYPSDWYGTSAIDSYST